jgi:predicted AlkP superfamily phosphohydrolase/phosphomutase
MSKRVLFVCLEAMEPRLLESWAEANLLPNIQQLINRCTRNQFEFNGATENIATWASIATGASLGEHGIWELYSWDAKNYFMRRNRFDDEFRLDPLWVKLDKLGKKSVILDWPRAPLRGGKNILQVSDWMSHYRTEPLRTTDSALDSQLHSLYPVPNTQIDLDNRLSHDKSVTNALDWLASRIEIKTNFVADQLRREDWDFFMVNYSEAHDTGHRFWALHDETHPQHSQEQRASLGDPLLTNYQCLDSALGEILQQIDNETVVMLYTSTGMEANYSGNGLLDFFLSLMEEHRFNSFFERPCFELRNHPAAGAIRISLKGRESQGVIDLCNYDEYCEILTNYLLELVDTETGRPVVNRVVKSREQYSGSRVDMLPDLLVLWNRETPIRGFISPKYGRMEFGDFHPLWTGDHSCRATLYVDDQPDTSITNFEEFPKFLGGILGVDLGPHS